jgi:hypothetical protein
MVENVAARTGASRKLENERKQQIVTAFLVGISEIEVKVGHDGGSSIACGHNVLDDRGTGERISFDMKEARNNKPDDAFPRARYDSGSLLEGARPKTDD